MGLIRGMARVIAVGLRTDDLLEAERSLRERSERQGRRTSSCSARFASARRCSSASPSSSARSSTGPRSNEVLELVGEGVAGDARRRRRRDPPARARTGRTTRLVTSIGASQELLGRWREARPVELLSRPALERRTGRERRPRRSRPRPRPSSPPRASAPRSRCRSTSAGGSPAASRSGPARPTASLRAARRGGRARLRRAREPRAERRARRRGGDARGLPRLAHRAPEPLAVHRPPRARARAGRARRRRRSPSSSATSTASRPSTTASATPPATSCCSVVGERLARLAAARRHRRPLRRRRVRDPARGARRARATRRAPRRSGSSSSCAPPFEIEGREIFVGASIGIAAPAQERRRRRDPAQRRPRDVPGEGAGQGPLRDLRAGDARRGRRAGWRSSST